MPLVPPVHPVSLFHFQDSSVLAQFPFTEDILAPVHTIPEAEEAHWAHCKWGVISR